MHTYEIDRYEIDSVFFFIFFHRVSCLTSKAKPLSSTQTDALYIWASEHINQIYLKNEFSSWKWCVCDSECGLCVRWSLSLFGATAPGCLIWYSKCPLIILELQEERERKGKKKLHCDSKFIYILVLQCVRPVILIHSTFHFVSGLHKPLFKHVMLYSRTTHFDNVETTTAKRKVLEMRYRFLWQQLPFMWTSERRCDLQVFLTLSLWIAWMLSKVNSTQPALSSILSFFVPLSELVTLNAFFLSPILYVLHADWTLHW